MSDKKLYLIGEVSSICNVPIKTLRYYDDIELIVPKERRKGCNYRYYTKEQMVTLFFVRKLRSIGISLKDIKSVLKDNSVASLSRLVEKRMEEIKSEIERLEDCYNEGEMLVHRFENSKSLVEGYSNSIAKDLTDGIDGIHIEEIKKMNCVYTVKNMETYKNADVSLERWIEIMEMPAKKGVKATGPVLISYHGDLLCQFLMKDCEVEFMIPVNEFKNEEGFKEYGGFKAVTCIHLGPWSNMINTYIRIIQWVNLRGDKYKISGSPCDFCLISQVDVENEEEHITKIVIPVEEIK